jgi:hypothetical protein
MNKSMYDVMSEASQGAYDFMRQLGELNVQTFDRMVEAQMAYVSDVMDKGYARAEKLAEAKGYKDVMEGQVEGSRELGQLSLDHMRKGMSLASEARDAYGDLVRKGYEDATAEVKKATAAKKTA